MKHTKTIVLTCLACLLATACDPTKYAVTSTAETKKPGLNVNVHLPGEENEALQHSFAGQQGSNSIDYIVDGQQYSGEITTEEDITTLYIKILDFAKLGHSVSVTAHGDNPKGTKTDIQTFSSDSQAKVATWSSRMVRKGYSVTIEYDKSTHTYNCTAFKRK